MNEPAAWNCRPVRDGDETELAALFERAFERPMTPETWRWKHRGYDDDIGNGWVAVNGDDRVVSHYGGTPRRARCDGRDCRAMVVADAMTAPEYQRRGAFTAVASSAHVHWREAGIDLVLGMPNERHGSRIAALGWQPVTRLRWMARPLRPDVLLRRRSRWGRLPGVGAAARVWNRFQDAGSTPAGIEVTPAEPDATRRVFAALATATTTLPAAAPFTVDRDDRWLTHRLLRAPDATHRFLVAASDDTPRGFCAYRVREENGRPIGAMVEWMADTDAIADHLVRRAAVRMRDEGAELAIALAVPGSPEHAVLRRCGFRHRWGEFDVCAVVLDSRLDADALRAAQPWRLSGADFDVI